MKKSFGWYLTLKEVAECGVFNVAGKTAIRSAQDAKLYEVLTYLSAAKAQNKFLESYYQQK